MGAAATMGSRPTAAHPDSSTRCPCAPTSTHHCWAVCVPVPGRVLVIQPVLPHWALVWLRTLAARVHQPRVLQHGRKLLPHFLRAHTRAQQQAMLSRERVSAGAPLGEGREGGESVQAAAAASGTVRE